MLSSYEEEGESLCIEHSNELERAFRPRLVEGRKFVEENKENEKRPQRGLRFVEENIENQNPMPKVSKLTCRRMRGK